MALDQDEVYQEIVGEMRHHQDTACFLGVNLDSDMKWKTYRDETKNCVILCNHRFCELPKS